MNWAGFGGMAVLHILSQVIDGLGIQIVKDFCCVVVKLALIMLFNSE